MPAPREDVQAALAGIEAAGNDTETLAEAIENVAFLENTPGEPRQKLRAARTKLKNIHKEAKAKKAAEEAEAIANRSPHKKDVYDSAEFADLVTKYEKLNWRIVSKPGGATMKPDHFYQLYGFHMMAENGENATERPMWAEKGGLDFDGRARWDAWTALKGMKADRAKLEFVRTYYEFPPKSMYSDTRGDTQPKQ
ncbi:g3077 [Coccomyxa viridis]|uniref:G3077 protein n=1 Tax=Coccomyxa viridis TaxID=1274662 RepID=A0ABP1FLX8_9CHLO